MDELWSGVQEVIADTALLLGCVAAAGACARYGCGGLSRARPPMCAISRQAGGRHGADSALRPASAAQLRRAREPPQVRARAAGAGGTQRRVTPRAPGSDNTSTTRRVYTGDAPVPITDYSISQARLSRELTRAPRELRRARAQCARFASGVCSWTWTRLRFGTTASRARCWSACRTTTSRLAPPARRAAHSHSQPCLR